MSASFRLTFGGMNFVLGGSGNDNPCRTSSPSGGKARWDGRALGVGGVLGREDVSDAGGEGGETSKEGEGAEDGFARCIDPGRGNWGMPSSSLSSSSPTTAANGVGALKVDAVAVDDNGDEPLLLPLLHPELSNLSIFVDIMSRAEEEEEASSSSSSSSSSMDASFLPSNHIYT